MASQAQVFQQPAGSPFAVGATPVGIATGDFNGDGIPDLAVADLSDGKVYVQYGDGSGNFPNAAPGSPYHVGGAPTAITVADFNGDGYLDFAVSSQTGPVFVWLGSMSGSFSAAPNSPFTAGNSPSAIATGDFNGDGIPDLVVTNSASNNLTLLQGDGTGNFTAFSSSPFSGAGISYPNAVVVGDFNGDGIADLAIANINGADVSVLLGNGSGGFTAAPGNPFSVGNSPYGLAIADFNLDGKPDLVVVTHYAQAAYVLLGNGSGGFSPSSGNPFPIGAGAQTVATGDFNGDGKPDFIVANNSDSTISVLLGDGTGTSFMAASGSPYSLASGPYAVIVADFNGDHRPDFAVANSGANDVTVELNTFAAVPQTISFDAIPNQLLEGLRSPLPRRPRLICRSHLPRSARSASRRATRSRSTASVPARFKPARRATTATMPRPP